MKIGNIYSNLPQNAEKEVFEDIFIRNAFKLERIISKGQATPEGKWYDQEHDEWVILLKGSAGLQVKGKPDVMVLQPGDYILLPAHLKHRVEWTSEEEETIWLALHY